MDGFDCKHDHLCCIVIVIFCAFLCIIVFDSLLGFVLYLYLYLDQHLVKFLLCTMGLCVDRESISATSLSLQSDDGHCKDWRMIMMIVCLGYDFSYCSDWHIRGAWDNDALLQAPAWFKPIKSQNPKFLDDIFIMSSMPKHRLLCAWEQLISAKFSLVCC